MNVTPIFRKETLNESRRVRSYWLRTAYVVVVFGMVVLVFQGQLSQTASSLGMDERLQQLAESLYSFVSITQIVLAMLITPVLVTGAFVAEKRTGTLALLSMTHLSDREIIVGKVTAKYLFMLMLILSALPMLGMIRIFGSVDARMIVGNTASAISAMLVAGAMASLYGLTARGITAAVGWTYLLLVLFYGVITTVVALIAQVFVGEKLLGSVFYVLNPVAAQALIIQDSKAAPGMKLSTAHFTLLIVLQLAFAALVAWRYLTKAEAQYRWWSLGLSPQAFDWARGAQPARTKGAGSTTRAATTRLTRTRALDAFELRERSARRRGRLHTLRLLTLGLVLAFEVLAALLAGTGLEAHRVFIIGQFLVLAIVLAVQSSAAIAEEKEDRTLGVLLSTPLSVRALLWGKIGSVLKLALIPVAIMVGHTIVFSALGLLHVKAVPIVAIVTVLYLGLVLTIGLIVSAIQPTAAKAMAWTIALFLVITLGTLMLGELLKTVPATLTLGRAITYLNPLQLLALGIAPGYSHQLADTRDVWVTASGATVSTLPYWIFSLSLVTVTLAGAVWLLFRRFNTWVRRHV